MYGSEWFVCADVLCHLMEETSSFTQCLHVLDEGQGNRHSDGKHKQFIIGLDLGFI